MPSYINFYVVFIPVFIAIHIYIIRRGLQAFPEKSKLKIWFVIFCAFCGLSFFVSRIIFRFDVSIFSYIIAWIGNLWTGAAAYLFLILLLVDLLRFIDRHLNFFPAFIRKNYSRTKKIYFASVCVLISMLIIVGYINEYNFKINEIELDIHKSTTKRKELTAAYLADIHLGTMFSRDRLERVIDSINSFNPDIVIIGGDIIDRDLMPVIQQDLGSPFARIKAPYGIIAITGNHEYYGGVNQACSYLEKFGVRFIRDSIFCLDNEIYFVGREDRHKPSYLGSDRKPLDELMEKVDRSKPVILLDHRPENLDEGNKAGADVQLSGHTHGGQLFPFSLLTKLVYEDYIGYLRKGNEHVYVTQGVGTWGPPMRLGSVPEIVKIRFRFE